MADCEEQMALVPSNGGNGPSHQEAVPGGSYFGVGEPRRIFVHAPQYHWHQVSLQGVDDEARRAIEQMGTTLYEFGRQTEHRLSQHERSFDAADDALVTVRQDLQRIGGSLTTLQAEREGLTARVHALEVELGILREEMGRRFAAFRNPEQEIVQLSEEVQTYRLEGRRKMAELEANVQDSGDIQRLEVKTELTRLEGKLRTCI